MEVQQSGRLEDDGSLDEANWLYEKRTHAGDHAIPDPKIRCTAARAIQNEQLMFQQNRLRNDGTGTSWPNNPANGNDGVEKNENQIPHS
jgi:hypothetical protein